MERQLPKKSNIFVDRKKLLQEKNKGAKKIKSSKKVLSQREKSLRAKFFAKLSLFGLILIFTITILLGGYIWLRNMDFENKFNSRINQLGMSCENTNPGIISSFLTINLDSNEKILDIKINLYNKQDKYAFDITNYEFQIDNAGNRGTVEDYIEVNNLFLDKSSLFQYISAKLAKELLIKIDFVLISQGEYKAENLKDILDKWGIYIFDQNIVNFSGFAIFTNICTENVIKFLNSYYFNKEQIKYSNYYKFDVQTLFDFSDTKKEQLRIYITNKTGVGNWGDFYRDLFQSYGLNVVKLDETVLSTPNTKLTIDDENLKGTNTYALVQYLMENQTQSIEIDTEANIFADIYIELGEDSVN